jgi:Transmembrane domain of unknown function (DUF3566)
MAVVKRISPSSAFKVGLIAYAILGLVLGIFMAVISMVASPLGALTQSAAPGAQFFRVGMGVGAIVLMPFIYGAFGAVFSAIGAAIYNLVAGWVGGLEVDIN